MVIVGGERGRLLFVQCLACVCVCVFFFQVSICPCGPNGGHVGEGVWRTQVSAGWE